MTDFITASGEKLYYEIVGSPAKTPLVLIHGQGMCGKDYADVAEKLSARYAVYLVDCFGHGKSGKNPMLYRCSAIGDAISELIEKEIGRPCILSGHSSGGILAAYIAGKIPELVSGVLLEDPPFFNAEPGEFENTFVYKDGFEVMHKFLQQSEVTEYLVYYLENGYIFNYIGDRFFGGGWAHSLALEAAEKLKESPHTIPKLAKLPEKALHGFIYWNQFDPAFSESFFTGEWFEGVSQEELLKNIRCPVIYLKAKTRYGKDGVLWAANSEESAGRVMRLLADGRRITVRCGHDIHFEKPARFLKAVKKLERKIKQDS